MEVPAKGNSLSQLERDSPTVLNQVRPSLNLLHYLLFWSRVPLLCLRGFVMNNTGQLREIKDTASCWIPLSNFMICWQSYMTKICRTDNVPLTKRHAVSRKGYQSKSNPLPRFRTRAENRTINHQGILSFSAWYWSSYLTRACCLFSRWRQRLGRRE